MLGLGSSLNGGFLRQDERESMTAIVGIRPEKDDQRWRSEVQPRKCYLLRRGRWFQSKTCLRARELVGRVKRDPVVAVVTRGDSKWLMSLVT